LRCKYCGEECVAFSCIEVISGGLSKSDT